MNTDKIESILRRMSDQKLALMAGLLKSGKEILTTDDVIERLKWTKDTKDDLGRAVGGVLSSLYRLEIPEIGRFIIPIGPSEIGSRRMRWKINAQILTDEAKKQLVDFISEVLKERKA